MKLSHAHRLLDLYEDDCLKMSSSMFISYLNKELTTIVSSTKELNITKEKGSLGDLVVIHYVNRNKDSKDKSTIEFKINVVGFSKNGKCNKDGVSTIFDYIQKDRDVKAMKKFRGNPKEVANKIKKYFLDNIKQLTKVDDIVSTSDFEERADEDGTVTSGIAGPPVLLGNKKKKKINESVDTIISKIAKDLIGYVNEVAREKQINSMLIRPNTLDKELEKMLKQKYDKLDDDLVEYSDTGESWDFVLKPSLSWLMKQNGKFSGFTPALVRKKLKIDLDSNFSSQTRLNKELSSEYK